MRSLRTGKLSEALLSISRHSVSADQAGSSGREIEKLSLHRPAATLSAKVIDVLSDLFIRRGVPVHTPDPAAVADAARYIKTLRDSGRLAAPGQREPVSGVTHQIKRDEQGRQVLRRKRFSIS
jgi:hypothetical protein